MIKNVLTTKLCPQIVLLILEISQGKLTNMFHQVSTNLSEDNVWKLGNALSSSVCIMLSLNKCHEY